MRNNPEIPLEELLEKTKSIYKLVILASKRALELNEGSPKLVDIDSKRLATIALEEIRQNKISIKEKKK